MLKSYKNNINQLAIDDAVLAKPGLWTVSNLFNDSFLDNMIQRLAHEPGWEKVEMQETLNRQCLPWVNDGLIDDVWCVINELNFSRFDFKLKSLTIWKDSPGYLIGEHVDNDRVIGSMQIYLNNAPSMLGTWFGDYEIPFIKNTGYIMSNKNKLVHGTRTPVPPGVERYSLYALFDLT